MTRAIQTLTIGLMIVAVSAGISRADDMPSADIKALQSADKEIRRGAANRIRLASPKAQREALPAMIDVLMRDKDGQVRLAVLDAVISLGPDAAPAVPALVHTLKTNYGGQGLEESHQDYRSALALAAIGKPALEGLRGLLGASKENVRAEVAMALGRVGFDASAAVPDLIRLLGDRSERVRREASRSLGLIGSAAIEPLIVASRDANSVVRLAAVEGLGSLRRSDDRAVAVLKDAAGAGAVEIRSAAIRALANLKASDDIVRPIARENLRHGDERVRIAIMNLLTERKPLLVELAPECESLLIHENEAVARHAADLLGRIGADAVPRLINSLRLPKSRIAPIAEALARIGRPAGEPLLLAADDPEPRVRRGAAMALGQVRPPIAGASKRLEAGLADADSEARLAFLTAVGQLGRQTDASVQSVRNLLKDSSPEIRCRAIEVLCQGGSRGGALLGDLEGMLGDSDPKVQRQTIDAIRALGPAGKKVLPAVAQRLTSENADVRLAAVRFVESHGSAAIETIPQLTRLLSDSSPEIRMTAATTLGHFGKAAQPAFSALAARIDDSDAAVREAAVSSLGLLELDVEVIRPALGRALKDEKTEVRRAATRAIPRLGEQGVLLLPDIILMAANRENARTLDRLLRPFEKNGPSPRSVPELVKCLEHKQPAVRLLAIKFLALAGKEAREALPALNRAREDMDAEVRRRAQSAYETIEKLTKNSNA